MSIEIKTRVFRLTKTTLKNNVTPDKINEAQSAILTVVAENTGGKKDGNTIATEKDIQGYIVLSPELGCYWEFKEIPSLKSLKKGG